jgi:hypothetical protein
MAIRAIRVVKSSGLGVNKRCVALMDAMK